MQWRDVSKRFVTAQRQAVPALATPLSIGRVGENAIELVGATHSSEELNRVPGAMIPRGSGQESLAHRVSRNLPAPLTASFRRA